MRKLNLLAAALALVGPAVAPGLGHAQAYGYGPTPAYAAAAASYAPYGDDEDGGHRRRGFELVGARAGITVLGVNLDGSAGVRLSVGDHGGGRYRRPVEAPAYAPPPYATGYLPEPSYPPPAPEPYGPPTYAPAYGYPCGCQPYGW